jgi:signal peptide peptidase SppA
MTEGSSSFFVKKEPKKLLDLVGGWIAGVWKQAPRVPVIRFTGIIAARAGSINLEGYAPLIDKAIAHAKKPKHLILAIESPGGSAAQSDLIGQYIRRKAVEKNIEITAVIGDVGASGGYWLACAADNIYANRLSIVGSIGVITGGFGFDRFIGRYEIERRLSTAGQNKARLDPFSPRDAADNAFIQDLLDEAHEMFKSWVRSRRGARLTGDESKIFDGGFMSGERALGLGLLDGLSDIDTQVKRIAGKRARAITIKPKQSRNLLRLITRTAVDTVFNIAEERANTINLR